MPVYKVSLGSPSFLYTTCSYTFFFNTFPLPVPGSPHPHPTPSFPGLVVSSFLQATIPQSCSQDTKAKPQKGKGTCPRSHSKASRYELKSESEVKHEGNLTDRKKGDASVSTSSTILSQVCPGSLMMG